MMKQNNHHINNNHINNNNNDFGKHDDFDWNKQHDNFDWNKQHDFDFDWCESPYYPHYPYPDSGCWDFPPYGGCEYPYYPYESEGHFMDMGGF